MSRTGETIAGKYRLLRLLGEGRTGSVYEAQHTLLSQRCAVKLFHAEVSLDPDAVGLAIGEARAASAVGHPALVELYEIGTEPDGRPFVAMEYLEGRSLAVELSGGRALAPGFAVEIVAEALTAVAAVHRRGLYHGALAPTALFVVEAPDAPRRVKVLDFGAHRLLRAAQVEETLALSEATLAAPQYQPPEQIAGRVDLDHRADLYALGAVLYQCLTGRLPYGDDGGDRLATRILTEPFPHPAVAEPSLHPALAEVVVRATAHYRDDRFGSADAMNLALAPFASAAARLRLGLPEPTLQAPAEPTGPAERRDEEPEAPAPAPDRRPALPALALLAGPIALAGLVALLLVLLGRREPGEPTPAAPPIVLSAPAANAPGVPPALPPPAAPAPPESPAAAAPPETVTVTLLQLPEGARAYLDGREAQHGIAAAPRGDDPLPLRITFADRAEFTASVIPDRDVVFVVPPAVGAPPVEPPPPPEVAGPAAAPVPPAVRPAEPRPAASSPAPSGGLGSLRMTCSPGARVAIPGHGTRNTPFVIELPPGTYRLLVANPSSAEEPRRVISVQLRSGTVTRVTDCW